jgi:hypothetical protein
MYNNKKTLFLKIAFIIIFISLGSGCNQNTDWGTITIKKEAGKITDVILENHLLKVRYANETVTGWASRQPVCIVEFLYKPINTNFAKNGRFDDMLDPVDHETNKPKVQHRKKLLDASIVSDGPDNKTVHLKWETSEEKVTLFRDSPIIQIDYLKWYVLITDWPDWPQGPDAYNEQMYAIYGADKWHRTYNPLDSTRQRGLEYDDIYFDRKPSDQHKQKGIIDPGDGGPLSYKGCFIVGAYKTATGHGFARVVPVERVNALVLWRWRAWEFCFDGEGTITTYLFPVSEGAQEIISVGISIADKNAIISPL